jgi:hypothetical protein
MGQYGVGLASVKFHENSFNVYLLFHTRILGFDFSHHY